MMIEAKTYGSIIDVGPMAFELLIDSLRENERGAEITMWENVDVRHGI